MEDKVRMKNLKSLLAFFEKFGRDDAAAYTISKHIMRHKLVEAHLDEERTSMPQKNLC